MIRPTALFINFNSSEELMLKSIQGVDVRLIQGVKSFLLEFETTPGVGLIVIYEDVDFYKSVQKYFSLLAVDVRVTIEHQDSLSTLPQRLEGEARNLKKRTYLPCHKNSIINFGFLPVDIYTLENSLYRKVLKKGESFIELAKVEESLASNIFYIRLDELETLKSYLVGELMLKEKLQGETSTDFYITIKNILSTENSFSYPATFIDSLLLSITSIGYFLDGIGPGKKVLDKLLANKEKLIHSLILAAFIEEVCLKLKIESSVLRFKYHLAALFHDLSLDESCNPEEIYISSMNEKLTNEEIYHFINHGERSVELVSKISLFPPEVLLLIQGHHEWIDGSGFPRGYGSERISDFQLLFNTCHKYVENYVTSSENLNTFFSRPLHFDDINGLKKFRFRFLNLLTKIGR